MKYNSIKNQMILTAVVSLFSIIVVVANQVYSARAVVELHKDRVLLVTLSNQLLQMRRAEKDFMMRLDPAYISKVREHSNAFKEKVSQVFAITAMHNLPSRYATTISQEVTRYSHLLNEMAELLTRIGTTSQTGYLNKLANSAALLFEQLEREQAQQLQLMLLKLRLSEQQFFQTKLADSKLQHQAFAKAFEQQLKTSDINNKHLLIAQLNSYLSYFNTLVKAHDKLGIDHNSGLQKQFRQSAHKVEKGLNGLNQQLTPVIKQKEQNVNFISSSILVVNLLVLVLAIAKNFHQLRRAFRSFNAFFQNSKHQKTLLDVQEVTFEEFKQLALVANEMIEERFRTEEELKQAKDKLTKTNGQLSKVNKELEVFASLDPLTKIANRRQLDLVRTKEWMRGIREQQAYSVVLIDVDFFKAYNDNYGHQCGDKALINVAKALVRSTKRPTDLVARYGGEEFAIVLPNTNAKAAMVLAEQMLCNVEQLAIKHDFSAVTDHITISAGVACAMPTIDEQPSNLFAKADKALYQAKAQGRNQVVISDA